MSNELERVLREHVLSPATGGTATGSMWRCACGASATVDGVRSWADEKGRAHLAGVILAALTPTPHGPVLTWRNDGGPWRESSKCKCGARHLHPTPDVDVIAEELLTATAELVAADRALSEACEIPGGAPDPVEPGWTEWKQSVAGLAHLAEEQLVRERVYAAMEKREGAADAYFDAILDREPTQ